jgi:1,4-dihydroxy-6-naphthoate synthase
MTLSIGFSPCPNDTFIFDALVNKKITTGELNFEPVLEDVQTLNQWAREGKLDITKLSFPALFEQSNHYSILSSGAALGNGVGPLLIAKKMVDVRDVAHCSVAIPGENTTANFLLGFAFPSIHDKRNYVFSEVEDAVLNGEVDLGVIIHENRFTYQQKGLHKICDLGEVWEERQKAPIPLGCIAIKRSIEPVIQHQVNELIKQSLKYALDHEPELPDYVRQHAREMNESVMRQHIQLYVNEYTKDLGDVGRKSIIQFFEVYRNRHHFDVINQSLFA